MRSFFHNVYWKLAPTTTTSSICCIYPTIVATSVWNLYPSVPHRRSFSTSILFSSSRSSFSSRMKRPRETRRRTSTEGVESSQTSIPSLPTPPPPTPATPLTPNTPDPRSSSPSPTREKPTSTSSRRSPTSVSSTTEKKSPALRLPPIKNMKEFIRSPAVLQSLNEKKPEKLIWDNVVPFARRSKPSEFDPARMYKFITWNVAGLRGVLRKDASALSRFMKKEKPDILCLQETKLNPAEAKENQQLGVVPGYWFVDHVSHAKKGYSGTRVYIHTAGLGKEWHVATTCGLAFPAETTPVLLAPSHPLQSGAGGGGATASVERTVREGSDQVRWPPDEEGRVQTIWLQPRTSTGLLAGASGVFPVRTPSCIEGGEKTGTSTTSRKRSREVPSSPTSPASPDKKKRKIENGEDGTSWPMGCEDTANKGGVLGSAIASFFPSLAVVNTYIPNSGMTLDRLPYRIEHFDAAMRSYLYDMQQYCQRNAQEWMETQEKSTKEKRSSRSPDRNSSGRRRSTSPMKETTPALYPSGVIWTGDLNVAEKDFDRYYAGTWKKMQECSGFTPEERFSFRETLDHLGGACDAFRMLYPQAGPTYTFWSSRISGREKGLGWRLDYFVVSKNLMPFVVDVFPMPEVQGSDHCPVQMWLKKQLDD